MSDQANTHAGIAARVRAIYSGGVDWFVVAAFAGPWSVVSRERGQVPRETRDGRAVVFVLGPYSTRRKASAACDQANALHYRAARVARGDS